MFKRSDERKSTRLKGYDYSQNGYYYVTICIEDMEHKFGFIENENMNLNKFGKIVQQCLNDLPDNYNNCFLDETIIMPNHIHCIIIIDNESVSPENASVGDVSHTSPEQQNPTQINVPSPEQQNPKQNGLRNTLKQGTNGNRPLQRIIKRYGLGEMMRSFKSNVTRRIKQIQPNTIFKWQRSFNDHIIRNEKELYNIRQYIRNNPKNW